MKLIIAGGRDFNDYIFLRQKVDTILANTSDLKLIISGGARGADSLAIDYAKERGYNYIVENADWDNISIPGAVIKYTRAGKPYNAAAGHIRNEVMAKMASHCICFYDGVSKGTGNMIQLAEKYNLKLRIIRYE